jgi:hypothetical protein
MFHRSPEQDKAADIVLDERLDLRELAGIAERLAVEPRHDHLRDFLPECQIIHAAYFRLFSGALQAFFILAASPVPILSPSYLPTLTPSEFLASHVLPTMVY